MTQKKIGKYTVEISNEDKIFFTNITKGDLINYYEKIANIMLPHIVDRPIMLHRFPHGITGTSFFQKNASEYFPDWIKQIKVPLKESGYTNYVLCQNTATLVYLANQAMITPHIWLSKDDKLHYPDKLVFDLDPSDENPEKYFKQICKTAYEIKQLLESLELKAYVMTTGSHGLHVVSPLDRSADFIQARQFAVKCAEILIQYDPENLTLELRKEKRGTKIFIDTLRNQYGATSVAPYGVRAYSTAPVAMPLSWQELDDPELHAQRYNIKNIFDKIESEGDVWKDFFKNKKSLLTAAKKLGPL